MATCGWLKAVGNACDASLGVPSMEFLDILIAAWHEHWNEDDGPEWPRTVCFCNDEEQIQLAGQYAMECLFGASTMLFPPVFNRLNHDTNRAIYAAGFGIVLHKKILECNCIRAPWQGGAKRNRKAGSSTL